MLHIAGVNYDSLTDGSGVRTAIFLSGCPHRCPGCHNPEAHEPNFGTPATLDVIRQIAEEINKRPYLTGVTLTGGDPFYNPIETSDFLLALRMHADLRDSDLWIYTGYTYEDLAAYAVPCLDDQGTHREAIDYLLYTADVLVDGPFIQEKQNKLLAFRGSSNQRVIDLNATRSKGGRGEIVLWNSCESW